MSERDIGLEILEGIIEVKAYKTGKVTLKSRELKEPSSAQIISKNLNLSKSSFAVLMGVIYARCRIGNRVGRQPSGPAKSLLRIAEQHPEVFRELLEGYIFKVE
jgi:putative transcriptional regulator